jgi:8-oxo-dGTP pyrophosphatase MutT (NUDIX family)
VDDTVNPLNDQGLYAWCMEDVEQQIDAALEAGSAALASVRAMPASQTRADAAVRLSRGLRAVSDDASAVLHEEAIRIYYAEHLSFGQIAKRLGISKTLAHQIITARGADTDLETEPSTVPEPGPVVAAIVTSHLGVLVGKRQDGKPPWTFIAGKIEPGESPADAAVREVKEETGLRIEAGGVIGRRVHPSTGRTMVYMAAQPTHGTDVLVGDEDELAEVRWVSLAEAEELMGGMIFEPVQKYLRQALGNGTTGRER